MGHGNTTRRYTARVVASLLLGAAGLPASYAQSEVAPAAAGQQPKTLGLVITSWYFGLYETAGGQEECPQGLQHTQMENYRSEYPTEADRTAREEHFSYYTNRGPHGENVFYNPTAAHDPLPFSELQSKHAVGLNLDGRIKDNDFLSPDGEPGIDNQLYRVIGCIAGMRAKGVVGEVANSMVRTLVYNRLLLEVTGVDDMENDDSVDITTYRGLDPIVVDGANNPLPWTSQRVDARRGGRFVNRLHGRIERGVLITDPADVRLPWAQEPEFSTDIFLRQAQLRLKLSGTGAEGLLGGYVDVESWWLNFSKMWGQGIVADITGWSAPTIYQALHRFADAYPDPRTGANTAISTAYKVQFVQTFISHPAAQADTPRFTQR